MPRRRWVSVWYTQKYTHTHAIFVVVHILRSGVCVCVCFFSSHICCCHFLWTIPIWYWHRYHAIRNPIMSIGFIVTHISVHLCCCYTEFVIYLDDLPHMRAKCYYSYSLSRVYCIKCNVNREQRILSTAIRVHSRNVIIILSFGFQVAWILNLFRVCACIQSFNMIISR